MASQRMISSSDKQRYSNTVVEFPQPLRENPCTNGHFQLIFLMRVRTGARPRALATLAARLRIRCAPGSQRAQPTPPTTLWLARFARFAFAPGARSALRVLGGRLVPLWRSAASPCALRGVRHGRLARVRHGRVFFGRQTLPPCAASDTAALLAADTLG